MFNAEVLGVAEVSRRLDVLNDTMLSELRNAIDWLGKYAQNVVKRDKLSGQVLGAPTGAGRNSIMQVLEGDDGRISTIVSTNLFYMIGWETGWPGGGPGSHHQSKEPTDKWKLTGGDSDHFANGNPKKRAFLIPTLTEMVSQGIIDKQINAAIARAVRP